MKTAASLLLVLVMLSLAGCGRFFARHHEASLDTETRNRAETILQRVLQTRKGPSTFKGIGNVRVKNGDDYQSGRMAWIGVWPDRFRIELLGPSGQPVMSISNDGKSLYFLSHAENQFHKLSSSAASLEKALSIPISPEDIVALLSANAPIIDYKLVTMTQSAFSPGPVLILEKPFWSGYEKIYLEKDSRQVYAVEMFGPGGQLTYKAVFEKTGTIDGYRVPSRLILSDGKRVRISLDVDRYWTDVDVAQSVFVLEKSKE